MRLTKDNYVALSKGQGQFSKSYNVTIFSLVGTLYFLTHDRAITHPGDR